MYCQAEFRARIESALNAFAVRAAETPGRSAAVAVAVTDEGHGANLPGMPSYPVWQNRAALILTRRSAKLRNHAGQWAFPGGRIDEGESPEETALREMREEIGLKLSHGDILGRLDDYVTRSGFVITPVVLWAGARQELQPNEAEVASIHRISVEELMRGDAPMLEPGPDEGRPILRMPIGADWIAAPTAAILYQFREVCVLERATRVGHFDQPAFAWR